MGHDDKELFPVLVHLRTLPGIDHVLEGEVMQTKQLAQLAQGIGFGIALHVYPGDGITLEVNPALFVIVRIR